MDTVCSLELPALELCAFVVGKEWISTVSRGDLQSQLTWKRVVPFRSSKVGTSGLLVEHEIGMRSRRTL